MKKIITLLVSILFFSLFSCEDELVAPVEANAEDVLPVDSEIYNLIERVASTTEGNEDPEITCINFLYPLTIFTYDEDLLFLDSQQITSDAEFSALLGSLESSYSISLSLPITTILDGGQTVNISSYGELKEVIDECMDDDFLAFCNANLPSEECIWRVIENGLDTGAYFSIIDDGSVTFNQDGETYIGTWVVLNIESEVHLNINLEGNSESAIIWNHDWLITLTNDGNFLLNNGTDTALLNRDCEDSECASLIFQVCENIPNSGIAEFDLSIYINCILSQTDVTDPSTVTVTFHLTQIDADTNANAIPGVFTNTTSPQTLFVRIEDNATGEATFVTITLEAISC